jgi:endonuclease-3
VTRLDTLLHRLYRFYGLLPAPPKDPFILFVWEVLSNHSTPLKRDKALASLKKLRALTPDSMWRLPIATLEPIVRSAGPYAENRLRNLRTGIEIFRRKRDLPNIIKGPLPAARRAIKPLPQLGEQGAHRMLLFTANHVTMPVDARVSRVCRRLGYGEPHKDFSKTARSVRESICRELPSSLEAYQRAYVYLAHHGAMTCAEAYPHCSVCPLLKDCLEGKKRMEEGDVYTEG